MQIGNFDPLKFERARGGWAAKYDLLRERTNCTDCLSRMRRLGLRLPLAAEAGAVVQAYDGERFALVDVPVALERARQRKLPTSIGLLWDASASARSSPVPVDCCRAKSGARNEVAKPRFLRDVGEDAGRFEIRGGDWSALRKVLESAVYDGASDLADWTPDAGVGEYLLVSDGLRNY